MMNSSLVEVVRFRPEFAEHFEALNREWIEKDFVIEEADRIVFRNPFKEIVEPGGQIFFVLSEGAVFGTCAVIRRDSSHYELAKMAVLSDARGRGFGDLLLKSAIEFTKDAGAERLILVSNTRLKPAIALYEKYGFRSVPITDAGDYSRVDIQMELILR